MWKIHIVRTSGQGKPGKRVLWRGFRARCDGGGQRLQLGLGRELKPLGNSRCRSHPETTLAQPGAAADFADLEDFFGGDLLTRKDLRETYVERRY